MKNIIIALQLTLLLQGIQTISACDDKEQKTQRIAPNLLSRKNEEIEMLPITKKSRIESNNFPALRALKKGKKKRKITLINPQIYSYAAPQLFIRDSKLHDYGVFFPEFSNDILLMAARNAIRKTSNQLIEALVAKH